MPNVKWMKFKVRSLEITTKTKPSEKQWIEAIGGMDQQMQSAPFWRGDLFNIGVEWFGDDFATSIFDHTKTNVSTWMNNASVCRRIPNSLRSDALSYSHHAIVAYLEPSDIKKYLQLAEENNLSSRQLGDLIKFDGKTSKAKEKPFYQKLEEQTENVYKLLDEAEGDTAELIRTAYGCLSDATEIERDTGKLEKVA